MHSTTDVLEFRHHSNRPICDEDAFCIAIIPPGAKSTEPFRESTGYDDANAFRTEAYSDEIRNAVVHSSIMVLSLHCHAA